MGMLDRTCPIVAMLAALDSITDNLPFLSCFVVSIYAFARVEVNGTRYNTINPTCMVAMRKLF